MQQAVHHRTYDTTFSHFMTKHSIKFVDVDVQELDEDEDKDQLVMFEYDKDCAA